MSSKIKMLQRKKAHRIRNFFLIVAALFVVIIVIGSLQQAKHPTAPSQSTTSSQATTEPSSASAATSTPTATTETSPEPSPAPATTPVSATPIASPKSSSVPATVTAPTSSPVAATMPPEPSPAPANQGIEFSIINVSTLGSLKRTVNVRLSQRVSKDVLRMMAQKLYVPGYDRTFISYWLPHMEVGTGAWATTHFNPDLEIRVLGMTPKQFETLIGVPSRVTILPDELIGKWVLDMGEESYRITIYQKQGVLYAEDTFLDGSGSTWKLIEKASPQGRRFEESSPSWDADDYYLLDNHGDLYMGDAEGLFERLQKIDAPSQTTTSSQTTTQPSPASAATSTSTATTETSPESSPAPANTQTETNDRGGSTAKKVEAWAATTILIKDRLKAPRTAKFNGGAWNVVYLGSNRYHVEGSVDSQNSFGAMIRTKFQAIVRDKGDEHQTWVLEDLQTNP